MAHGDAVAGRKGTLTGQQALHREIDPPRRLVFTWGLDDESGTRGHETEITVIFEPALGGTSSQAAATKRFNTKQSRATTIPAAGARPSTVSERAINA